MVYVILLVYSHSILDVIIYNTTMVPITKIISNNISNYNYSNNSTVTTATVVTTATATIVTVAISHKDVPGCFFPSFFSSNIGGNKGEKVEYI